jgi:hypothetical protein
MYAYKQICINVRSFLFPRIYTYQWWQDSSHDTSLFHVTKLFLPISSYKSIYLYLSVYTYIYIRRSRLFHSLYAHEHCSAHEDVPWLPTQNISVAFILYLLEYMCYIYIEFFVYICIYIHIHICVYCTLNTYFSLCISRLTFNTSIHINMYLYTTKIWENIISVCIII